MEFRIAKCDEIEWFLNFWLIKKVNLMSLRVFGPRWHVEINFLGLREADLCSELTLSGIN